MPSGVAAGVPERRGSTSSEGSAAGSTHTRSLSSDEPEYLQAARARITKATPPKPAANPLQFIKIGPCDLFRSAQEQLKRAEEVRKTKEVKKEEQEDWQSNLDNWKSSRRKRVEHIIERCVEVKKMSEEEQDRAKRRSKTFSEMMEDRAGRKSSRLHLPIYSEEDNNDLSDLGIGTSSASGKSSLSEDCDNHSLASDGMDLDKNHFDLDNMSSSEMGARKLGSSANEYDTCTTATISSPEPEEYTYEGAIQGYKSRVISRTQSTEVITSKINGLKDAKEKSPESYANGNSHVRRPSLGNKIENKLSSFEPRRASSVELNNIETKKVLPKVDVLKRRELFEKESSPESNGVTLRTSKLNGDIGNSKSIKERLSHLEKLNEYPDTAIKSVNILPTEATSLKERLTSLEKHTVTDKNSNKLSNGDLTNVPSVRDRLSSLKSYNSQDKLSNNNVMSSGMTQTIKERLSSLDACNKNNLRSPEREINIKLKNGYDDMEFREDSSYESHQTSSERNSSPESGLYDSKRFHRSLDSLDTDDNLPTGKFERIQSSEDLCGETGTGGETDREDSGIHTGDVSCAVSHADETIEDHLSLTLLGTSTISQDTVVNAEGVLGESPQPDLEDSSYKDFCPPASHSSLAEDDPPTVEEASDIFFDREEEDTVKSMEADTSVSLQENSVGSESENMVFEGKMLIHVNFKEICSKMNNSVNIDLSSNNTNVVPEGDRAAMSCDMPMVMVSQMSTNKSSLSSNTSLQSKPEPSPKPILSLGVSFQKCRSPEDLSPCDKFTLSPPVLESNGRWTILQINNKTSPASSQPATPVLDIPEIIPDNFDDDYEYNCLEEKLSFKVCNNFFHENVKHSLSNSPPQTNGS